MEKFYKIMYSNNFAEYIRNDVINNDYKFTHLSKNGVIEIETIEKYTDLHWDKNWYIENPNITWNLIKHKITDFDRYILSKQKFITSNIILHNKLLFSNMGLSNNPNVNSEIFKNDDINWEIDKICKKANLDWNNELDSKNVNWNYWFLSLNTNLTWSIILKHHDKPWCYKNLSRNSIITPSIVENNLTKDWCWINLSTNPNINIDFIKKFYNKGWSWILLTKHKNISWNHILENLDLPWSYVHLSKNPNITPNIVKKHLSGYYVNKIKPNIITWNMVDLAKNPNFTLIDVLKLTNIYYQPVRIWDSLSSNRNIDWIDIRDFNLNAEKIGYLSMTHWNYLLISQNDMFYARQRRIKHKMTFYSRLIFRQLNLLIELQNYVLKFI